jgi:hypothetical protein
LKLLIIPLWLKNDFPIGIKLALLDCHCLWWQNTENGEAVKAEAQARRKLIDI